MVWRNRWRRPDIGEQPKQTKEKVIFFYCYYSRCGGYPIGGEIPIHMIHSRCHETKFESLIWHKLTLNEVITISKIECKLLYDGIVYHKLKYIVLNYYCSSWLVRAMICRKRKWIQWKLQKSYTDNQGQRFRPKNGLLNHFHANEDSLCKLIFF